MKKVRYVLRTFGALELARRGIKRVASVWRHGWRRSGGAAAGAGQSVLVIDEFVPFYDRSAGGKRLFELLKLMRASGYRVTFVPHEGGAHEPYASAVRALGAGALYIHSAGARLKTVERIARDAIVWISRPEACAFYLPAARAGGAKRVVFDTVDLHFRRLEGARRAGRAAADHALMRDTELRLAKYCDVTVVTTPQEAAILREHGVERIAVVPVVQPDVAPSPAPYETRSGLLFLGNYTHEPNEDAAEWFVREILPLLTPGATLTLAGAEPTKRVRALRSPHVLVSGYVADLAKTFDAHRVFVAPLRYGAGIKGKIVEALARGLPVVTTTVGAEGIGLQHERDAFIVESPAEFAAAVAALDADAELWQRFSRAGYDVARGFLPENIRPALLRALEG